MRVKIILVITCLFTTVAFAQKSLSLEGSVQAGLLEGEKGSAFQFGMMGGLRSQTWTASVGTGLDYYGIRSIPVFLQVNKKIFNAAKTPFVFLGSGYHFPWLPEVNNDWPWWGETKTRGGLYYNAGIGYQLPVMKNAALFFSAGYSFKQYQEELTQASFCIGPGPGPCPTYKETFTYRLRRLSVTTGLRF